MANDTESDQTFNIQLPLNSLVLACFFYFDFHKYNIEGKMWLRCSRGYHWYELMRYNNELIDVYDIALLYNNINKSFTYNLTSIENIHLNMLKNKSFRDNIMSQISANMVEENKIKTI